MPEHRIKKSSTTTMHISAGNTPNTAGIGVDTSASEAKVKMSIDNTSETTKANFRTLFDSHVGAAGEGSATATSYAVLSQQQNISSTTNGNAADTTADVLMLATIPANALSTNGKRIRIKAWGGTAADATNKSVALYFGVANTTVGSAVSGGTSLIATGSTTTSAASWCLQADVVRAASAKQAAIGIGQISTLALAPTLTTGLTVSDTAAITVAVTGASGSSAANAVYACNLTVEYAN